MNSKLHTIWWELGNDYPFRRKSPKRENYVRIHIPMLANGESKVVDFSVLNRRKGQLGKHIKSQRGGSGNEGDLQSKIVDEKL